MVEEGTYSQKRRRILPVEEAESAEEEEAGRVVEGVVVAGEKGEGG